MSCQHPDLQRQMGPGTSVGWEPPPAAAGGFGRCLRGVRAAQRLGLSNPGQPVLSAQVEQTLQRSGSVSPAGRGRTRKPLFSFFSPAPLPATHRLGLGVGGGGIRGRAPAAAAATSPSLASLSSRRGSDTGGWRRSCPRRSSCHLDTRLGDQGWIGRTPRTSACSCADTSVPAQATHGAPLAPGHRLSFIPTKTTRESPRVESHAPGPTLGTPGAHLHAAQMHPGAQVRSSLSDTHRHAHARPHT